MITTIRSLRRSYLEESAAFLSEHAERLLMNGFMFGIILAVGTISPVMAIVAADPWNGDIYWHLMGGVGGAVACVCAWKPSDVVEMARNTMGNGVIAIVFGPYLTRWFADRIGMVKTTPEFIMLITGMLGLCSVFVLRAVGPKILDVLTVVIPAVIESWIRRMFNMPDGGKTP